MSCGGGHLEFSIGIKKPKLCRGPSNDHSWAAWIQLSNGGGHLGFPIGIENIKFVENLPMIIPGQFGFNCSSGFREEAF